MSVQAALRPFLARLKGSEARGANATRRACEIARTTPPAPRGTRGQPLQDVLPMGVRKVPFDQGESTRLRMAAARFPARRRSRSSSLRPVFGQPVQDVVRQDGHL